MKITNDEEYFQALARLVKGADYISNPLIKPDDYDKGMKLFDELAEKIIAYRTSPKGRIYDELTERLNNQLLNTHQTNENGSE
jgi:hypothetical protein